MCSHPPLVNNEFQLEIRSSLSPRRRKRFHGFPVLLLLLWIHLFIFSTVQYSILTTRQTIDRSHGRSEMRARINQNWRDTRIRSMWSAMQLFHVGRRYWNVKISSAICASGSWWQVLHPYWASLCTQSPCRCDGEIEWTGVRSTRFSFHWTSLRIEC